MSRTRPLYARRRSNALTSLPRKTWILPKNSAICWSNTLTTPPSFPRGGACKIYHTDRGRNGSAFGRVGVRVERFGVGPVRCQSDIFPIVAIAERARSNLTRRYIDTFTHPSKRRPAAPPTRFRRHGS